MTVLTEGRHTGEFMLSEANGSLSREVVTIAAAAGAMAAGTVLGKITVGGKYVAYDAAVDPADGSETAAAVLYAAVPDSDADQEAVVIIRQAEVKKVALTGIDDAGVTALAALDIICR